MPVHFKGDRSNSFANNLNGDAVTHELRVKRVYQPPESEDGYRVLVDRLWPRGISKDALEMDEWLQSLAPSGKLRRWFHEDRGRFDEFTLAYIAELNQSPAEIDRQLARLREQPLTLLTSATEIERSHAGVLRNFLQSQTG